MNPWQSAADSYQQGLQGLGQAQQGAYREMANAPLKLYQMFMEGYEKANQRKMQEEQLARQNRLADIQNQRQDEQERQNKMLNRMKIAEYVSKTLRGDKQSYDEVMSNLKGSSFEDLVPQVETVYTPKYEGGTTEAIAPDNPLPPQPAKEALPSLKYPMGSAYRMQMEKEAQDKAEFERRQVEAERKALAIEEEKRLGRISAEEAKKQHQQLLLQMHQDRMAAAEAQRGLTYALGSQRLDMQRSERDLKREMKRKEEEADLYGIDQSLSNLKKGIAEIRAHPGFEAAIGKSSVVGHFPYTEASGARGLFDNLKSKLWVEAISAMRSPKSGATGLGAIAEPENKRIEKVIANLDLDKLPATDVKAALDKIEQWADQTAAKKREFLNIKYGGGDPAPTTPPNPGSGGMVDMIAPDGGKLRVPASDVEKMKKLGARVG